MLKFHYENVLRDDFMLKCNYNTIMQIPQIIKIVFVYPTDAQSFNTVALALELICGQKLKKKEGKRSDIKSSRVKKSLAASALLGSSPFFAQTTLRGQQAYNFLDKFVTVLSFHDCPTNISEKTILITLSRDILRLFPEIQNSFELFESMKGSLYLTVVTSALTQKENQLLWTGFLQKERAYV